MGKNQGGFALQGGQRSQQKNGGIYIYGTSLKKGGVKQSKLKEWVRVFCSKRKGAEKQDEATFTRIFSAGYKQGNVVKAVQEELRKTGDKGKKKGGPGHAMGWRAGVCQGGGGRVAYPLRERKGIAEHQCEYQQAK